MQVIQREEEEEDEQDEEEYLFDRQRGHSGAVLYFRQSLPTHSLTSIEVGPVQSFKDIMQFLETCQAVEHLSLGLLTTQLDDSPYSSRFCLPRLEQLDIEHGMSMDLFGAIEMPSLIDVSIECRYSDWETPCTHEPIGSKRSTNHRDPFIFSPPPNLQTLQLVGFSEHRLNIHYLTTLFSAFVAVNALVIKTCDMSTVQDIILLQLEGQLPLLKRFKLINVAAYNATSKGFKLKGGLYLSFLCKQRKGLCIEVDNTTREALF